MSTKMIIGITGLAGSGKSTAAKYLNTMYGMIEYPFASPLKDACAAMFGIPRADLDDPVKKELITSWGVTPRQILQFMGTEVGREALQKLLPGIGTNFWVTRMQHEMDALPLGVKVVIPDVRFQNEADFLVENNGLLLVITGRQAQISGIENHSSEIGIDLVKHYEKGGSYYVIDNSLGLTQLYDSLDETVKLWNTLLDIAERGVGSP